MKRYFLIIGYVFILLISQKGLAQDFKDQFNQFKTTNEKDYEKAIRAQDSVFAKSIVDNWGALQLKKPQVKVVEPKPEVIPIAPPSLELKEVNHKMIQTSEPKLMRSFNQPKFEIVEDYDDFELSESYEFHGEIISLKYSGLFLRAQEIAIDDEKDLAQVWKILSKSPYQNIVRSLYDKSKEMNLPDYGYILLIDSFLKKLEIDSDKRSIYKWFLLSKSNYKTRIGLIDGQPVLVIASYGKIYGKRYFSVAGINYYVMSDIPGKFESYQTEGSEDENLFDFSLNDEIKLPLDPVKKDFSYNSSKDQISISVYYNANLVNLLEQFPQSDLTYYLSSSSSDLLQKSLQKSFDPYLEDLTEVGKVEFLMNFVQKAFEYQTDQIQFGKERVMYPEELFYHDYADCDDRVVLLAFLLRVFTDVPTIALKFPQHVALGIRLPNYNYGETVEYKGYSFAFCDPTYFNAPLGSVIPKADRSKISIVEF